jgi:cyclopropane fatty-acyl-phospholipid synthase-like methyltransferase
MSKTADYYDASNYLDDEKLRGTGVVGLISGDQLHPPMIDDAAMWQDLRQWKRGAAESVRRLIRNARISPGDIVLDVGCGIGGATRMLSREFDALPIGLNISEEQMRTARKLGHEGYVKGSAEEIPVASNAVDSVLTVNMFYHLPHKSESLREMYRVTRPGGTLAFDDWVVTSRATDQDRADLQQHWNPEPVRWITDDELEREIMHAGYHIERIEDFSHVGRGVMAEHFGATFEREVRPLILEEDPVHGESVADYLRAAIDHTIEMYRQEKMKYLQIVARKR